MISNNSTSTHESHAPMFTKYSIKIASDDQHYIVKKYDASGRKTFLEGAERDNILNGEAIKGSIGYTKDTKHQGWLHIMLYITQVIHECLTGRWKSINPDGQWIKSYASSCHGVIIVGPSTCTNGTPLPPPAHLHGRVAHPLVTVDPLFPGMLLRSHDNLRDFNVTKFYVFTPVDNKVAELIQNYAIRSAFPRQSSADQGRPITEWKFYRPGCITEAASTIQFCFKRIFRCLIRNRSKKLVAKNPIARVVNSTSLMLADLLLEGPGNLRDDKGNRRPFYCCSYVTTILQGALFMKSVDAVSPEDTNRFLKNDQGEPLDRLQLQAKIKSALRHRRTDCAISNAFYETFKNEKFARADAEFFSSARFVELASKRSKSC